MFSTIYKHEILHWLKSPSFYIYAAIFLLLSTLLSAATAGIFDGIGATTGSAQLANAPIAVNRLFNTLSGFVIFLCPAIIGAAVYRDYKSEMHTILYSYPFSKRDYLFAKFFSGVTIVALIVLMIGAGMCIGFRLPGVNQALVGSLPLMAYVQAYAVYTFPNILLYGAIVFAVVTFSRNIAAGFVTIILLNLVQGVTTVLLIDPDNRLLAAMIDPSGLSAMKYYTDYWTVAEQNTRPVPVESVIVYNRLLWSAAAALVFGLVYAGFTFSQQGLSFSFRRQQATRAPERPVGGLTRIRLPEVAFDFSLLQSLKIAWKLSAIDFRYIVKSWPFILFTLFGLVTLIIEHATTGIVRGTMPLPVTWLMLNYSEGFMFSMMVCTFLYSGLLVNREKTARMDQFLDTTPVPNWSLPASKFLAILKMQFLMTVIILISGLIFQIYKGYYNFEIGVYLFGLFVLNFSFFPMWAMLSFFVQTLIRNPYVGLFIMIAFLLLLGTPLLRAAGIEQDIFIFGRGPDIRYSDMNGYGADLPRYFMYRIYWLLAGGLLLIGTGMLWVRGLPDSFKERLSIARSRFRGPARIGFAAVLVGFLSVGLTIYHEENIANPWYSSKDIEAYRAAWEQKYKTYEHHPQPRIVSVKTQVHIFPEALNLDVEGVYTMVNKSGTAIDSLFIKYQQYPTTLELDRANTLVATDTLHFFNIYWLEQALLPGDSLDLRFTIKNKPNTWLTVHAPVRGNGTFFNNKEVFPSIGYTGRGELQDDAVREKYGLPPNDLRPHPSDTTALGVNVLARDADWIDFEATVSTAEDQIAIAPGYLQKEWVKDGRRYFHYKMDSKILNFYAFNSARYEVKKDRWNDVALEIYYHKGHTYNLDRMMAGLKKSLAYNADAFSPYQHKQARIVEFPRTSGNFAQSFPNTIPFSEGRGFIANVDDSEEGGVDYPFAVTAHEVAHQWWAHQVMGADVQGATVLSESLSDYVRLKVLEHQYGKGKMRQYLKYALDDYLRDRGREKKRENPLMYNDGQAYIRYSKGSLVFYALSDYIGEENLNAALSAYVEKVKFQEPPYTTTLELVDHIRPAVPDSLQYIIKDMLETVTLYDNRMVDVVATSLDNGKYQVDMTFQVAKYRNDEKGKRLYGEAENALSYQAAGMDEPVMSVPLADYIEVGVFAEENETPLYLKKHKITAIHNKVSLIVDGKPTEAGIDPYNKLIDADSDDNRKGL